MPREVSEAFESLINADGCESRRLMDITLASGAVIHLSDAACTVDGIVYEPDIRDIPEIGFSEDDTPDGSRFQFIVQNCDGLFGVTDETGATPLERALVCYRHAVAPVGTEEWETDIIGFFIIFDLEINEAEARFNLVADYADPTKVMSGGTIFLEELTPVMAQVSGVDDLGDGGRGRRDFQNERGGYLGGFYEARDPDDTDRRSLLPLLN